MAEEKLFEGKLKNWLHSVGVYPAGYGEEKMTVKQRGWYTKIWGGGYQKAGIPDIIACIKGQFVTIEVKASSGRPSELQKLNTSRIRMAGGHGIFLYPSGFEQFKSDVTDMIDQLKYDSFCYQLKEEYK